MTDIEHVMANLAQLTRRHEENEQRAAREKAQRLDLAAGGA